MFDPAGPVLGIDPGLSRCGYGAVRRERGQLRARGVRRDPHRSARRRCPSGSSRSTTSSPRSSRELRPSAVAVERVLFQNNARTAISVGQASGLALVAAARAGVPVAQYSPNEVKLAVTGDGRADKRAVQTMVTRLLALREVPKPPDAADALALACCHLRRAPALDRIAQVATRDRLGARRRSIERSRAAKCSSRSAASATACSCPLSAVAVARAGRARVPVHAPPRPRRRAGPLGFPTRDERDTFEALIGASGVGPKLALAILSVHAPDGLRRCLAEDDLDALVLVPGVGKRTAQRLLVDLKARLEVPDLDLTGAPACRRAGVRAEVRDALAGLGYRPTRCARRSGSWPRTARSKSCCRDALRLLVAGRDERRAR